MHYAKLDKSERLQRVDEFLDDGIPHSTRDIIVGANVCAVNSAISELRRNGRIIETGTYRGAYTYRKVA
jgi:hypothetical protein